jgi:hypothetical protein
MLHDYWNPLFGGVEKVHVGFLSPGAARELITNPAPAFDLEYDADLRVEIYRLSGGQPYLVQLLCHRLVTLFNTQNFESGEQRERRFHLADLQAVLDSSALFDNGHRYFSGVWAQAESAAQRQILQTLAIASELDITSLRTGIEPAEFDAAIDALQRHDVVRIENGRCRYTVELMRRWVKRGGLPA